MDITAKPAWTLYMSEDTGYKVVSYKNLSQEGNKFTATGYYIPSEEGIIAHLTGEWTTDKKYGQQFKVRSFSYEVENTMTGIVNYLSSGLVSGIGRITAERIYRKFGKDTMDVMDNNIDRLKEVKGISAKKLVKIKESYGKGAESRELITFLAGFSINPKRANDLIKAHKFTLEKVKENPYRLTAARNISFGKADEIARALSFKKDDPKRIESAVYATLFRNEQNGNIGMPKEALGKEVLRLLNSDGPNVTANKAGAVIAKMYLDKNVYIVKGIVYRSKTYDTETSLAKLVTEHKEKPAKEIRKLDEKIASWEKENNLPLDATQREAVTTALSSGFSIITGGPGRGKTTIARAIVDIRKKHGQKKTVWLVAPTGRAATRLAECTGHEASTIHSAFGLKQGFEETEGFDCEAEQLLIDEASMVDMSLMEFVMWHVKDGCNITIIGDPYQLPSVGAGAVLRDMIDSKVIPVVELKKIYRQGDGSVIIENSVKINSGRCDISVNKKDFIYYNISEKKATSRQMVNLYKSKVKEFGWENVALLSPFHRAQSETSTDVLNSILQEEVNPIAVGKEQVVHKGHLFREADIVMQTHNKNGISNGDIGRITAIDKDEDGYTVTVDYGNISEEYVNEDLDILELAYAISIHKSQGSEYKCVIMCLLDEHNIMLKRNLFYTAVTRASKEVHLVGSVAAVKKAIQTEDTNKRITLLSEKLKKLNN